MSRFGSRLRAAVRRILGAGSDERDLDDEIRSYLQHDIDNRIERGASPDEARRAALIELGGTEQVKAHVRESRTGAWFDGLVRDVRYSSRILSRDWGFTLAAVLTLAAGIAGITAIFTIVNAVILRPLPYRDAGRLIRVSDTLRPSSGNLEDLERMARASLGNDWRDRTTIFEGLATFLGANNSSAMEEAVGVPAVEGARVTPNFFSVLGVQPLVGRDFTAEDGKMAHSIILSHSFWQQNFGGDPNILGTTLAGLTVIGVMPPDVSFPFGSTQYWTAVDPNTTWGGWNVGRLRPGLTIAQAEQSLATLIEQIDAEYDRDIEGHFRVVEPISAFESDEDSRTLLLLLFGSGGGLLLIAVMNVANLMLGRGVTRQREFQVRAALGMSRWQLLRQLFTESVLLSAIGGCIGFWLAYVSLRLLITNLSGIPRIQDVSVDFAVAGFMFLIVLLSSLTFSILPTLAWSGKRFNVALREGIQASESRRGRLFRQALISMQIAVAALLLTGAAFTGKSFWNIIHVPLGFDTDRLVTASLRLPDSRYETERERTAFYGRLLEELRGRSEIESASLVSGVPIVQNHPVQDIILEGSDEQTAYWAWPREVTGEYFETLGIDFTMGRVFKDTEQAVVINETLRDRLWPNSSPLGQQLRMESDGSEPWLTVVGVVPDTIVGFNRTTRRGGPQIFLPCSRCNELMVITRHDSARLQTVIREALDNADQAMVLSSPQTMDQALSREGIVTEMRSRTDLFSTFSAVGLLLALVGVYSATSYSAARRVKEIGIRMALGSTRTKVVIDMMSALAVPLTLGLAGGLWAAGSLTQFLRNYLFEMEALDPSVFAIVGISVVVVVLLANLLAVWRGTSFDPAVSLRVE